MAKAKRTVSSRDPVSLASLALVVSLVRELRIKGVLDEQAERRVLLGSVGTLRNILHMPRKTEAETGGPLDFSRLLDQSGDIFLWGAENKAEEVIDEVLGLLGRYHHLTPEG